MLSIHQLNPVAKCGWFTVSIIAYSNQMLLGARPTPHAAGSPALVSIPFLPTPTDLVSAGARDVHVVEEEGRTAGLGVSAGRESAPTHTPLAAHPLLSRN